MLSKIKNILINRFFRGLSDGEITLEELKEKQKEGAIIIDVRSPQEYKEWHIDGAVSMPEYELNISEMEKICKKNEDIVVYCRSGSRGKKAKNKLENMGYTKVFNLYNGFENY